MKNRDKYILKVNEYDMLMKIAENCGEHCAITLITGENPENYHRCYGDTPLKSESECSKCIQKWLNEEE